MDRIAPSLLLLAVALAILGMRRLCLAWARRREGRHPAGFAHQPGARRARRLVLGLAIAAALVAIAVFAHILDAILEAEAIVALDRAVHAALAPFRSEPAVAVFRWLTAFGNAQTVIAVTLVVSAFFLAWGRPGALLPLWVTLLGAQLTVSLVKLAVDRARPDAVAGLAPLTPSFPSGHATTATALYGLLAWLAGREMPSWRARFETFFWAGAIIALIGFSRVLLGVHWLSDVVAGHLLGLFWLLVGIAISEARQGHGAPPRQP